MQLMRRARCAGMARPPVQQVGGSVESPGPEARRHGGVKQESANAVVQSAQHTLGLAVLLTCVGAGEAKDRAVFREKRAHGVTVEFATIVTLNGNNG